MEKITNQMAYKTATVSSGDKVKKSSKTVKTQKVNRRLSDSVDKVKVQSKKSSQMTISIEKLNKTEVKRSLSRVVNHIKKAGKASLQQSFGGETVNRGRLYRSLESTHVGVTRQMLAVQSALEDEAAAVSYAFDDPSVAGMDVNNGKIVETDMAYIEFVDGVLIKITRKSINEGAELQDLASTESYEMIDQTEAEPFYFETVTPAVVEEAPVSFDTPEAEISIPGASFGADVDQLSEEALSRFVDPLSAQGQKIKSSKAAKAALNTTQTGTVRDGKKAASSYQKWSAAPSRVDSVLKQDFPTPSLD